MSNRKIKPVVQTYFEVSNVKHRKAVNPLTFSEKFFYLLKNIFTKQGQPVSLKEVEQLLNHYENNPKGKDFDKCLLKGLYSGGYNTENCIKSAPFLFFDIDVKSLLKGHKKDENKHLFNPDLNNAIFNELKKIAVLVWRSNSGTGIAGILFVPQLSEYLGNKKDLHLSAGKAITDYLSKHLATVTGTDPVSFDNAQSKFRQVRYLANQKGFERTLNPYPYAFSYEVEEKTKELQPAVFSQSGQTISPPVIAYRDKDYKKPFGTIYSQYDEAESILKAMLKSGFSLADSENNTGTQIRVKHKDSDSSTAGVIDTKLNIYFNYSETLGGKTSFTPSGILGIFKFGGNWYKCREYLTGLGYTDKEPTAEQIKEFGTALKEGLAKAQTEAEAGKVIFKYCFDLKTLKAEDKRKFIKDFCPDPKLIRYFKAYLELSEYQIKFDKQLTIESYVSEALPEILKFAEQHPFTIIKAETGKGKTTAFIKDFHTLKPEARILVLEPLTVIIHQSRSEYKNRDIYLTGTSSGNEFKEALKAPLVVATYEQGIKLLSQCKFDFIVVDEAHQLITANSFKRKIIADLTPYLYSGSRVIGLTGTPLPIFKQMGFSLLNVAQRSPKKTPVEVRYSNKDPFAIALSHLLTAKGKTLIRLNNVKTMKAIKKQLIITGVYKKREILILYSDRKIKNSEDFSLLAGEGKFKDSRRLVLTTSVIDEGLSIRQAGFTDVVFIETNYSPRPEPIKQYFARFRNEDPQRRNYLYLRQKNDQTEKNFNPVWAYQNTFALLNNEIDTAGNSDVFSTYNSLFDNDPFYYEDRAVNPFYLAYSVTETLFKTLNCQQFLEFLEVNYSLSCTINEAYTVAPAKSIEADYRANLKRKIAFYWLTEKADVLQVIAHYTQKPEIRKELTAQQRSFSPEFLLFVQENLKDFEKLYQRFQELAGLGVKDPNTILLKDNETLGTEKNYKDSVLLLKMQKTILESTQSGNEKTPKKYILFAKWATEKKEFTYSQMTKQVRGLGVFKNSAYNEKMLFTVLLWFGVEAKRNKKTNIIHAKKGSTDISIYKYNNL